MPRNTYVSVREYDRVMQVDDIFRYMDDLTVALKPEYNPRIVAQILEEVLQGYGLKLNKRGEHEFKRCLIWILGTPCLQKMMNSNS